MIIKSTGNKFKIRLYYTCNFDPDEYLLRIREKANIGGKHVTEFGIYYNSDTIECLSDTINYNYVIPITVSEYTKFNNNHLFYPASYIALFSGNIGKFYISHDEAMHDAYGHYLWMYEIFRGMRKGEVVQMIDEGNVIITTANRLDGKFGLKSMIAESAFNTASTTIKSRYGEEIYLDEGNARRALDWIKEYDKKYDKRPKDRSGMLKNTRYIIKLDEGTFCDLSAGSFIDRFDPFSKYTSKDIIKLYIFGKHYRKFVKELDYKINHNVTGDLYIYNIKGYSDNRDESGVDSVGSIMKRRSIDTLFFNDNVKESIIGHIDNFLANKHIYEEKTLNYKTGILLYGVPGSGKTSLATAIATYYNYNLIVLDLTTFEKLDTATLTGCINADSEKFVILLEDIDTLFPSLDRQDDLDDKTRNIINKMLQFLDSSSSPNDVIFIATTNDISKLDSAILREGRFDIKVEVGNINKKASTEMLESFNIPAEDIEKIWDEMPKDENGNINPAALQNKAISYFKKALAEDDSKDINSLKGIPGELYPGEFAANKDREDALLREIDGGM